MPHYHLVVFDFDGTLADSMPWFLDTINGASRPPRLESRAQRPVRAPYPVLARARAPVAE